MKRLIFFALVSCITVISLFPNENAAPFIAEPVNLPHRRQYAPEAFNSGALSLRFTAYLGQAVTVTVRHPAGTVPECTLYELPENGAPVRITGIDAAPVKPADDGSAGSVTRLRFEPVRTGSYAVRLTVSGTSEAVELTAVREPVLLFPVSGREATRLVSIFGDGRDQGTRLHEGIDIAAARHTPVLAAADGYVRRVGVNARGGNVVTIWDPIRKVSYYYAHLETQDVAQGVTVKAGDRIGTVGNSGNASATIPHLHFTVYGPDRKAVDPYPYVYTK
jgi:murein DD-endopeptidase MepM/ murein hydrolase activator NlpD